MAIIDVAGLRRLPQTAGDGRPLCLGRLWRRRGAPIECLQTPQQPSRTPSRSWLCRRVGRMSKGVRVGGGRALLVGTVQRMPSFSPLWSSVPCVLTAGGLCPHGPVSPTTQSLASSDCDNGEVTDRQQLGHRSVSTVGFWGMGVLQIPPGRDCSCLGEGLECGPRLPTAGKQM